MISEHNFLEVRRPDWVSWEILTHSEVPPSCPDKQSHLGSYQSFTNTVLAHNARLISVSWSLSPFCLLSQSFAFHLSPVRSAIEIPAHARSLWPWWGRDVFFLGLYPLPSIYALSWASLPSSLSRPAVLSRSAQRSPCALQLSAAGALFYPWQRISVSAASLRSSHPLLPLLCPQAHSLHLHL